MLWERRNIVFNDALFWIMIHQSVVFGDWDTLKGERKIIDFTHRMALMDPIPKCKRLILIYRVGGCRGCFPHGSLRFVACHVRWNFFSLVWGAMRILSPDAVHMFMATLFLKWRLGLVIVSVNIPTFVIPKWSSLSNPTLIMYLENLVANLFCLEINLAAFFNLIKSLLGPSNGLSLAV